MDGTFQNGEMRVGNVFRGNIQSRATVTRIEKATIRLWMCDITTVAYGKDSQRFVMNMTSVDNQANDAIVRLQEFVKDKSLITVPTSEGDRSRNEMLSGLEKQWGG